MQGVVGTPKGGGVSERRGWGKRSIEEKGGGGSCVKGGGDLCKIAVHSSRGAPLR